MDDAQTRRFARNWAKHQLKKASRPKKVASEKVLAALAQGRAVRAMKLAQKKSGGGLVDYARQASQHASQKAVDFGKYMGKRMEADLERKHPHVTVDDPEEAARLISAYTKAPPHLYKGLAIAGTGALGYGLYRALQKRREREVTPEQAEIMAEMREGLADKSKKTAYKRFKTKESEE